MKMNTAGLIENNTTVIKTKQGLFISGTRITLYDIMDYIKDGWPPHLIQKWFDLSEKQIKDVMEYINNYEEEVETEYQFVLKKTEEIKKYWEERNQERFDQIAKKPPRPGNEKIREKLQAWKVKLEKV